MSEKFSEFDFDEFNETFSGGGDGRIDSPQGRHMREEAPHTPRHASEEPYYDLENFDEAPKTKEYPGKDRAYAEPKRRYQPEERIEPSSDYGDDFYSAPGAEEDPDDRTAVFDKVEEQQLASDLRAGRQAREYRQTEREEKKKNGILIAVIIVSAVILIGLIVFLTIFLTGSKGKKDETKPSETAATQAVSEKATEKPTEAPKTEAPKPTKAPRTEAPKTEAPKPTDPPQTEAPAPTDPPQTEAPAPTDPPQTEAPDIAE